MFSLRQIDAMVSSPRKPSSIILIFSSAEYCLGVFLLIAFTHLSTSDFGLIIGSFYGLLAAQSITYLFRSNEPNWSDSTQPMQLQNMKVIIMKVKIKNIRIFIVPFFCILNYE